MSHTENTQVTQEVPSRRFTLVRIAALIVFLVLQAAALWLNFEAKACIDQTETEREHLQQTIGVIPAEERTDAQHDMVLAAWVREGELELQAAEYNLYAAILRGGSLILCGTAIFLLRHKS